MAQKIIVQYSCDKCGKEGYSKDEIYDYRVFIPNQNNSQTTPYMMELCGGCATLFEKEWLPVMREVPKKSYKKRVDKPAFDALQHCPHCDFTSGSKQGLGRHITVKHGS